MKKIFVQNSVGGSGKDTWASLLNKHISTYKYSIVDLPKEAAKVLGWDGGKTEKDRKFLSDVMDLSTEYNDAPFKDVLSIVMRDPKDIARAVETFGAETILIRNPNVRKIESNHADRYVENYEYDYIIENDGTLEQLEKVAKLFVCDVICGEHIPDKDKPFTLTCSKY